MDGNYGGTMEFVWPPPTPSSSSTCRRCSALRVARRQIRYRNRTRPDMAPGCPERLTWFFLKYIWNYRRDRRPGILERMARYAEGRRIVHLQTPAQVVRFVDGLPRLDSAAPAGL